MLAYPELKYEGLRLSNSDISIIELKGGKRKRYKVTRRMPQLKVAETKVFISKKKALAQLQDWLS